MLRIHQIAARFVECKKESTKKGAEKSFGRELCCSPPSRPLRRAASRAEPSKRKDCKTNVFGGIPVLKWLLSRKNSTNHETVKIAFALCLAWLGGEDCRVRFYDFPFHRDLHKRATRRHKTNIAASAKARWATQREKVLISFRQPKPFFSLFPSPTRAMQLTEIISALCSALEEA